MRLFLEEDHILDNYKEYLMTFLRFLDDIFLIWLGSIEEIHKFFEFVNSIHDSIKLTFDYSKKGVNFLDTTIYL